LADEIPVDLVVCTHGPADELPLPRAIDARLNTWGGVARLTVHNLAPTDASADQIADCLAGHFLSHRRRTLLVDGDTPVGDVVLTAAIRVAALAGARIFVVQSGEFGAVLPPEIGLLRGQVLGSLDSIALGGPGDHAAGLPSLGRLLRASVDSLEDYPLHSSIASLLRSRGSDAEACRLEANIRHWIGQRLWSQNRIAELVVHDERHSEHVDRHIMELCCRPPIREQVSPRDLYLLGCAAWLHDWGHVSVPLSGWLPDHPLDVRDFHGLLTQRLLAAEYADMHNLDADAAAQVGVLAAHHQGWTSFGDDPPAKRHPAFRVSGPAFETPPTLRADAERNSMDLEKTRLLVALLRVADAADIGSHRIPDYAARPDYLRLCRQREAVRTAEQLAALRVPGSEAIRMVAVADPSHYPELLETIGSIRHPLADRFAVYMRFLDSTEAHYVNHRSVRRVSLSIEQGAIAPLVTPSRDDVESQAKNVVDSMLADELVRPEGSTVAQRLRSAGIGRLPTQTVL